MSRVRLRGLRGYIEPDEAGERQSAETALSTALAEMDQRGGYETGVTAAVYRRCAELVRAALPASTESTGAASGGVPAALDVERLAKKWEEAADLISERALLGDAPVTMATANTLRACAGELRRLARSASEPAGSAPDWGDSTETHHRSDTRGPCLACRHRVSSSEPEAPGGSSNAYPKGSIGATTDAALGPDGYPVDEMGG